MAAQSAVLEAREVHAPNQSGTSMKRTVKSNKRMHNKDLGRRGEEAAARFLFKRGYEIVERNWVCPFGEADIVARDGDELVFVEVKTRSSIEKGFPSEAVNEKKRGKYERIAMAYVADCDEVDVTIRFDVISIIAISADRAVIRHHINAFSGA